MAAPQRATSYRLFAALCCIFLGSVAGGNVNEPHRILADVDRLNPEPYYAVWGGTGIGAWANIVEFNLKTGEAGQVVLKNDRYVAPVAPAVNPATNTLYWPVVEIGRGGTFGAPQLAIVNTTSKPWAITRRITLGPSDPMVELFMQYAFFDSVHQRVWVLALQVAGGPPYREYLWSVDPETNTYEKIELGSVLPNYNSERGVLSAAFNPETRRIVLSVVLIKGNATDCYTGACVPAIAMFDIDHRTIVKLSANDEMAATALVWDSYNKEIYSFLESRVRDNPPLYYGRVDAQTGIITTLIKYGSSYDDMVLWCNPLYDPSSRSVIAPLGWYNQIPQELTVFEPTTGHVKHSSTFNNTSLHQMFIL